MFCVSGLFSSATQVKFLCPDLDSGTRLSVTVETRSTATKALTFTMQETSPTILSLDGSDGGQGLVSFLETPEVVMNRNSRIPARPAQPGDRILIWTTGLGSAAETATGTLAVKLGGIYAEIESVHAVPGQAGLYAIQVNIPRATPFGDSVPVQVLVATKNGGQAGSNIVTISVEAAR